MVEVMQTLDRGVAGRAIHWFMRWYITVEVRRDDDGVVRLLVADQDEENAIEVLDEAGLPRTIDWSKY